MSLVARTGFVRAEAAEIPNAIVWRDNSERQRARSGEPFSAGLHICKVDCDAMVTRR